ncbi:alpha-ketoglutarate-dependent dioxygenase alkB homolog 3-like [Uloborus diversus]|uniref:alpha-ketoglutarate-dependent dioxygenase alkB homolog 3-like n=1 Tax=Uloborus diversus TaxID=327109 RepID=UPI0024091999|nr:alpha-ketoglutarate-dependent dioxygenase alkB homolog 3-like [Uloborus diversus]
MEKIRRDVCKFTGIAYNYALINYYSDSSVGIGQHKDNESSLDEDIPITALSFGATRTLQFERRGYPTYHLLCKHGDLYQMLAPTNKHYTHGIKPEYQVTGSRISITFRKIIVQTREDPLKPADDAPHQSEMCALGNPLPQMQHDPLQQVRPVDDEKPEEVDVSTPPLNDESVESPRKRARSRKPSLEFFEQELPPLSHTPRSVLKVTLPPAMSPTKLIEENNSLRIPDGT